MPICTNDTRPDRVPILNLLAPAVALELQAAYDALPVCGDGDYIRLFNAIQDATAEYERVVLLLTDLAHVCTDIFGEYIGVGPEQVDALDFLLSRGGYEQVERSASGKVLRIRPLQSADTRPVQP